MPDTVTIALPVETEVVADLSDAARHDLAGRLLSGLLRPREGEDPLVELVTGIRERPHAAGITDEIVDAELAAAKAERQNRR